MQMFIRNININYNFYRNDSDITLVYLHGWGQNIKMMMPIAKPFIKKYSVLIVDLPGFGESDEPKETWSIYDYADCMNEMFEELNIKNPILIGHSFGGKVSLAYATKYKTNKLVLLASPYKKNISEPTFKMKIYKDNNNVSKITSLLSPLTFIIVNVATVFIVYFAAKFVDFGELTQGDVFTLVNYMNQILLALIVVSNLVVIFTKAFASLKSVRTVADDHIFHTDPVCAPVYG